MHKKLKKLLKKALGMLQSFKRLYKKPQPNQCSSKKRSR